MMAKSRVIIIKDRTTAASQKPTDEKKFIHMLKRGLSLLENQLFFPNEQIGIKINTIGGKSLSTRPELSFSLAACLIGNNTQKDNIVIWDRTNRELRSAGYHLKMNQSGIKVYGTNSVGIGYEPELTIHMNIGSRFSKIQTKIVKASISLAILKDHGLAGITAGMKNYFGAIHNPNKYHDSNCDPYVAEVFATAPVRSKHRLTILDALTVQYHRGPSYHSQWAEKYGALIFSTDPVAADYIGWQIIERLRAGKGLPSLQEENRRPVYIRTAEKLGLGRADRNKIVVIEEEA